MNKNDDMLGSYMSLRKSLKWVTKASLYFIEKVVFRINLLSTTMLLGTGVFYITRST